MYVSGILEDEMNEMMNYVGGNMRCLDVTRYESCRCIELVIVGNGTEFMGAEDWYSMKFDRRTMLLFEDDGDVVSMIRENDDDGYLYVGRMEGPCARRSLVCEQQQWVDYEVNVAGVVQQRGLWGVRMTHEN